MSASANGTLEFRGQGLSKKLSLRDLVTWGAPADARQGPQILLADGGLLVADLIGADEERLTVDSLLLGKLALPLEQIAGIVFLPPLDAVLRDELIGHVRASGAKRDMLILENGDQVAGTILNLTVKQIELEAAVGQVKLETDRLVAIVFDPSLVEPAAGKGFRTIVGLVDGSRLMATSLVTADAKIRLTLVGDHAVALPAESVVFLQPLLGKVVYLSDLKPAGYKHIPFLDLPREFRLDRNGLGTSLRSGGQSHLKGVGMHSASRLTFPLDGRHRRFAAEVALDDRAGPRGSVVFRVFVDAEQKYASPILRGGDAPQPIFLEIPATARTLSLIVDFADRGDELDYANWLDARLEP